MSELATNAFIGRTQKPSDADLGEALGPVKPAWDELIAALADEHQVATQEWKSYSTKSGWSLRLMRSKRTIVWLAPLNGGFQVAFILGDKAVSAARESGLPKKILDALDTAKKYPEGTGLRLLVKSAKDIPALKKLAAVKIAN